jgi:hypothetical protein
MSVAANATPPIATPTGSVTVAAPAGHKAEAVNGRDGVGGNGLYGRHAEAVLADSAGRDYRCNRVFDGSRKHGGEGRGLIR